MDKNVFIVEKCGGGAPHSQLTFTRFGYNPYPSEDHIWVHGSI